MLHAATAILVFTWTINGLVPHANNLSTTRRRITTTIRTSPTCSTTSSTSTSLYGGYDATIGADPNTPIQVYCSEEKTPSDLCTFVCLAELDLKYEIMSELPNPVPDWFLRIHPDGTTPALRNPVDKRLNNDIVCNTASETDKVNQYLCKVYQGATNKEEEDPTSSSCPLLPSNDEGMTTMESIQRQIDETILPACVSFLENDDINNEAKYQAAAENALRLLFQSQTTAGHPFLIGSNLTLVDIYLFTHLKSIFLELNRSKKYILPSSTMGSMKSWHDACASRPAFREVLSKQE
ncbi:unnamed protein product [Cylindrotheca closterium]|uniref:GST C-terminal domain-containing protein n=1 Tax=Cylindrotheca closterium TaxID=2856 RepID=A0AAD2FCQ3_9STRA|nr:unnamed protein product [Cylindrotheca closterium]